MIRSYFAEDILKHDPLFYIRQDNSKYYQEDKDARLTTKDSLFADPGYGDKEYHDVKEYPTIFHLRQALLRDQIKDEERYSLLPVSGDYQHVRTSWTLSFEYRIQ